jgi:hypothetical protein
MVKQDGNRKWRKIYDGELNSSFHSPNYSECLNLQVKENQTSFPQDSGTLSRE